MKWWAVACILLLLSMPVAMASALDIGDSSEHFKVSYTDPLARPVNNDSLFDVLESAYDHVNGYFGTCPGHIEVIVIGDRDMDKVGKQVDSFFAWNQAMSAIILRQGTLKNKTLLPVIVSHEVTHLAINDILSHKDPEEFHWLEEGICMAVSREPLDDANVSRYIVGHGFINKSAIFTAIKSENCTVSKNGYMNSFSLVKYIEQRYGLDAVLHMLECPENSFDKAFQKYSGEDFGIFYDEWKTNVIKNAKGR
jgi:hypothetical protein